MNNLQTAIEFLSKINCADGASYERLREAVAALRQFGTDTNVGSKTAVEALEVLRHHPDVEANSFLRSYADQALAALCQPAPSGGTVSREVFKATLIDWLRSLDWSPSLIEAQEFADALQLPAPAPIPTVSLDGIPKRVVLWGEVPTECVRTSDIQMFDADKLTDEIDGIAYDYMSTNEQNAFMRRVRALLTALQPAPVPTVDFDQWFDENSHLAGYKTYDICKEDMKKVWDAALLTARGGRDE